MSKELVERTIYFSLLPKLTRTIHNSTEIFVAVNAKKYALEFSLPAGSKLMAALRRIVLAVLSSSVPIDSSSAITCRSLCREDVHAQEESFTEIDVAGTGGAETVDAGKGDL
jgi:hypothetical protein